MAVSKILIDGVGIDLTGDTVTADKVAQGYTFHDATGAQKTGTNTGGGSSLPVPYFEYDYRTGTDRRSSGYTITKSGTIRNLRTGAYFDTKAYATVPATFDTAFTEWSIRVDAMVARASAQTYMRICRADTDALSAYLAYSSKKLGIKLTNRTISSDADDIEWYDTSSSFEHSARNKNFSYVPTYSADEAAGRFDVVFVSRSDGYVYFYFNGDKICRQRHSMIGTFSNYGVGDTGGNNYYATAIRVDAWEIYNVALSDDDIKKLHGIR